MDNWPLFGRIKRAVKKVRFLLNYRTNRWRLASMINRTRSRRLSFNDRPGILGACHEANNDFSRAASLDRRRSLQRTTSYPSEEEDVDRRAEMFISNFRRQLQMERQVSLELTYCRRSSFGSVSSP